MSDNLVVMVQPIPAGTRRVEADMICLAGVAEAAAPGPFIDIREIIVPEWQGKYTVSLVPLDASFEETGWKEAALRDDGISHVALVRGPKDGPDMERIVFAGEVIDGLAMMLWFSERDQQYRMVHCWQCATGLISWFTSKQEAWDADAHRAGQVSTARN